MSTKGGDQYYFNTTVIAHLCIKYNKNERKIDREERIKKKEINK